MCQQKNSLGASPREEVACPDGPMTNTLPEMPSQGAGRIIHHVRWQHRLERDAEITVVGEASDGPEAITLAQALQPDVVLMDIALPTMDGITAAAVLRALVPHSAVVFLSLYDDAATRARADAAGGAAFVGKHEGVHALQSAIRQAGKSV